MQVIPHKENLPSEIAELSKFVLVGREKLIAVRAEIRAIDKVQLAQGVRDQKLSEARMLSEALLDAEVKLGEMTKNIPKAVGGRPIKTTDTAVASFAESDFADSAVAGSKNDSAIAGQRPKREVIRDLGFTPKQVERFEKLADNQDLVELAKAQARENDDIPTRTQVLSMAEARQRKFNTDLNRIDTDYKSVRALGDALSAVNSIDVSVDWAKSVVRGADQSIDYYLEKIDSAAAKLSDIRRNILLQKGGRTCGKK